MASLLFDNFENLVTIPGDLLTNGWTAVNGSPDIETTVVALGSKSLRLEDDDSIEFLLAEGTGPEVALLKFRYRFTSADDYKIVTFYQGANENVTLRQNDNGQLQFYSGGQTAVGAASVSVFSADIWYDVRIKLVHRDSIGAGEVILEVNGTPQIILTAGTDTAWFGNSLFVDGFGLHGPSIGAGEYIYVDHVDFLDTDADSSSSSVSSSSTSSLSSSSSSSSVTSSSSSTSLSSVTSSSSSSSVTSSSLSSGSSSSSSSSESSSSSTSVLSSSSSSQSGSSGSSSSSSSSSVTSSSSSSSITSSSVSSSSVSSSSMSSSSSTSVSSFSSESSSTSSLGSSSSSISSSSVSSMSSSSSSLTSSSFSEVSSQSISESSQSSSASSSSSSSRSTSDTSSQSSSSESLSSTSSSSSESSSGAFGANLFLCADSTTLLMEAWRRRDSQYLLTLQDANSTNFVIDATNVVILKIGKVNQVPHLELNSVEATPNGSALTATNPVIIRIDKDDLLFAAAVYDLEVVILDSRTGDVVTTLDTGSFVLHETQRGVLAL